MGKRYDNDFDAEGFVENFRDKDAETAPLIPRAIEDPTPPKSSNKSVSKKSDNATAKKDRATPSDTAVGFKERFINNLKYKNPKKRYPQIGIYPDFIEKIQRMQMRNGAWGCSVATYINNVLECHFDDNEAIINDLINNSYTNE